MGTKLRVLRRFHYPSGPSGRDYNPGEEMEVLSERDAKALTLIRAAELMPEPASAATPTRARSEPQEEATRSEIREEPKRPVQPLTTADVPSETSEGQPRRRYRRSDMVAEEE